MTVGKREAEPPAESVAAKTERVLAAMWVRNKPTIAERVAVLRTACDTISKAGSLAQSQREEAISAAHKLAGVLGMFGFPEGTEAARKIELLLESAPPPLSLAQEMAAGVVALERIAQ